MPEPARCFPRSCDACARPEPTGAVVCQLSVSLDGFVAGPNQSLQNPLGEGGMQLHDWVFATASWRTQHGEAGGLQNVDSEVADELSRNIGACIMGRRMFGGGSGPWDSAWKGWWGDDPPYHAPVFVLTHYPRQPLPMKGGTTFHFVNEGIEAALIQARDAARAKDVSIAGGASAVQQYLAAGLLDELYLHIVPLVLGSGERLFEGVGSLRLEQVKVVASAVATHIKYRVIR